MTIRTILAQATKRLQAAEVGPAQLDAQLLLAKILDRDRSWLLAHDDRELTTRQLGDYQQLIARRAKHEPLVHLTGQREFYGLEFKITPDVLTPRIETEPMVELAIKETPQYGRLLDVGTGSGAIAIAVAKDRPDLTIAATDVSATALKIATANVRSHEVKVVLIESNLLDRVDDRFDTITANLPYLRDDAELTPEVQREPKVALLGGPDGLDLYRGFFRQLPAYLNPSAWVMIESDPWQHPALIELAKAIGLELKYEDYFVLGFKKTVPPQASH